MAALASESASGRQAGYGSVQRDQARISRRLMVGRFERPRWVVFRLSASGPATSEADVPPMAWIGREGNGGFGANGNGKLPLTPPEPFGRYRTRGDVRTGVYKARSSANLSLRPGTSALHPCAGPVGVRLFMRPELPARSDANRGVRSSPRAATRIVPP